MGRNEVIRRLAEPIMTPKNATFRPPNIVNNGVLIGQVPTVKLNAKEPIQPKNT